MRPEARVWRKTQRNVLKGVSKGRRRTHRVETQEPVRGSSWQRRHPEVDAAVQAQLTGEPSDEP